MKYCVASKEQIESLYFLEGKNWHALQIPKAHFSNLIWLICGKIIIYAIFIMVMDACTIYFYKYEHIYTYRRKEFQENWKARKLVWTVVPCLILNMELNLILILLIEFACIRQS